MVEGASDEREESGVKSIALAASLFLVAPAAAQTADISAAATATDRVAAAHKLIDTILPPASRDAMFAQMVNTMMTNMTRGIIEGQGLGDVFAAHPDVKPVFGKFVERQRKLALADLKGATPALIDAQAEAYAKRFTVGEMIDIAAFFASPTGQKYQQQSMAILGDPGVAAWQAGVAARAQLRMKGELEKLFAELNPILERDKDQKDAKHS